MIHLYKPIFIHYFVVAVGSWLFDVLFTEIEECYVMKMSRKRTSILVSRGRQMIERLSTPYISLAKVSCKHFILNMYLEK